LFFSSTFLITNFILTESGVKLAAINMATSTFLLRSEILPD